MCSLHGEVISVTNDENRGLWKSEMSRESNWTSWKTCNLQTKFCDFHWYFIMRQFKWYSVWRRVKHICFVNWNEKLHVYNM